MSRSIFASDISRIVFLPYTLDSIKAFPNFHKRYVEWSKAEAKIIRFTEIGDDVHLFDQGAVDAVTFGMADADVRSALGRVTLGSQGKSQMGQAGYRSGRMRSLSAQWIYHGVRSMPACRVGSRAVSIVSKETMGCVPARKRVAPGAGV